MTNLSVNVNKVALLRNQRDIGIPSVTGAAQTVIDAGAAGVTVHPRPDQRHIRPEDCDRIAPLCTTVEFNIEGNPFAEPRDDYPGLMNILREIRPDQATLVPDSPGQSTSDHGWDLAADGDRLRPLLAELRHLGCRVSLFMDAEPDRITAAADVGADRVELYTESYARAFAEGRADEVLPRFVASAERAAEAALGVNAGHDLNLENLGRFCSTVPGVLEVSIGHALIADALTYGLAETVRKYLDVLSG
ncbi:MAG: pyridoxine 5'-phosphate synthase [Planctomycetota bacterium]